jgi:gliding-associated putative ABC transporter substrate-binding component GldG
MNRKELKKQNITQLILAICIVVVAIIIASYSFFRIDLTQEKRYTLSDVSKNILHTLPDEVLVKVYLDGDIPIGFKRLSESVREMLDEFRVYAGNNVQYQFIDPYSNSDPKSVDALVKSLYDKGIQPTNVKIKDAKGGFTEKMVIPGALVSYNGVEFPINLLSNNPGLSGEQNLNNSVQALEYKLINAIHSLSNTKLEKIAFLEGQGELDQYQVGDITRELANYFQVDRGSINGNVHALDVYKCVIIAKPQKPFTEEDKFVLDQYLMNGGKILWFIDPVKLNTDSLAKGGTLAFIQDLNIDDQLFKYGIRVNPVLLQDVQCSLLPVNTSESGTQSKFTPEPWLYNPLLSASPYHPASRNLNMVLTDFCSYIDTLDSYGKTKKSILLESSKYTHIKGVPSMISLSEINEQHQQSDFDKSFLPVAVMVEGTFTSNFKNRMLSQLKINGTYKFRSQSVPTKMLVVADGDIIRNDVRTTPQGILISPLGFDKYISQTFGNKEFVLNVVNYVTDETGIMNLRTREVKLRLLDKFKVQDEKLKWQLINVILPVILVVLAGIGSTYWRRRKYAA